MKVRVSFRSAAEELDVDDDTELTTEAALLSLIIPSLSESLSTAVANASSRVVLQVAVGGDQFLLLEDVIKELPDDGRVLHAAEEIVRDQRPSLA